MSIKKNIFYNISLSIINMLFPVATAPYISRVLGVENVGIVNFALSYVSYFMLFATLGVGYYGVREIARHKDDKEKISQIFSGIFRINIVSTAIVSTVYFLTIFSIPSLSADWKIFVLAGISLYLVPTTIDWYFQGLENFKVIAYRSLVIKCMAFAGLFIFVQQREDVIPYVILSSFAILGNNVWNMVYAKKQGLKIKWTNIHASVHIKPMLVFFVTNVIASIFNMMDTLMLGFMSTYEQVGFFTSPNKILILVITGFGSLNAVLIPRISFNRQQNNNSENMALLQKTFDITSLFVVPVAIGLCLISSRFVPLFFGSEFMGSILPMQILSFKVIVVMINCFFVFNILMAYGHENKFLIVAALTAVFSFTLNWILIPLYGAVGVSITSVAAESVEIFLNLFLVYKFTKIRINWKVMLNSFIFALSFFVLYALFSNYIVNDIIFLFIFVISSILVYFSLQFFLAKNYLAVQILNMLANKINR